MKRSLRLLGMSGLALGTVWFVVSRRPDDLRRFVTHRFDPFVMRLGLAGGRVSPWGVIEHEGRVSHTTYHTPVYPRMFDDHMYIPLPYGKDVQWVRNIQAAGHCRVELHETILDLDEPAIVDARENPMLPAWAQRAFERSGRTYLRLHVLDRVPGAFTRHVPETTAEGTTDERPAIEIVHPAEAPTPEPVVV